MLNGYSIMFLRNSIGSLSSSCEAQHLCAIADWAARRASSTLDQTSTSVSTDENSSSKSSNTPAWRWLQPAAHCAPWTPSKDISKPKHAKSRMGFLMQTLEEEQVQANLAARPMPDFRVGDVLEVRMVVPEAGRKEYLYRGLCIARYNKGIRSAFKIFNVLPDSGGFVQHLPLYMPDLLEVKVVGRMPARRSKLYYLLDHERSSNMKFQPPVVNAANIKPEGERGAQERVGSQKGKSKKSKKK